MVGRYNGNSKPAEPSDARELTKRPTYVAHGANWAAATSILRQGLRAAGRQDIRMAHEGESYSIGLY